MAKREPAPIASGPGRRSGRPRAGQGRLSKDAILDEALRIVDRDGVAGLSMRRLAAALDVNPMSIYHHLPNKAAVLSGLVERVYAGIHDSALDDEASWQDQLRHSGRAHRRALQAHPNLALQIISNTAAVADAIVTAGEPIYAALERSGLSPRGIVEAADTIVDFVHGFMLGEAASTTGDFDLGPDLIQRVRALPAGSAPAVSRVVEALGADGLRYEYDRGFEAGLDILVKGIEARAAR